MRLWHANPPYRLNSSHVSLPDVGRIRIAATSTSELFSKLFLYQLVTYGTGLTPRACDISPCSRRITARPTGARQSPLVRLHSYRSRRRSGRGPSPSREF